MNRTRRSALILVLFVAGVAAALWPPLPADAPAHDLTSVAGPAHRHESAPPTVAGDALPRTPDPAPADSDPAADPAPAVVLGVQIVRDPADSADLAEGSPSATAATAAAPAAGDPEARARAALEAHVPAAWLAAVQPDRLVIVDGHGSRTGRYLTASGESGLMVELSRGQLRGSWAHASFVVVHEWAHLVALRYGTQGSLGAPPPGFPYAGPLPEEVWADCVAKGLTGVAWETPYPDCDAASLAWAGDWVAAGPDAYQPTA